MMHCINLMSISFSVKSSQKDFHGRIVPEITFQWSVVEYEVLKNLLICFVHLLKCRLDSIFLKLCAIVNNSTWYHWGSLKIFYHLSFLKSEILIMIIKTIKTQTWLHCCCFLCFSSSNCLLFSSNCILNAASLVLNGSSADSNAKRERRKL